MKVVEVVPQKTFNYGDGVPAYKSGEWYGSKPNHFIGSKLILKPIQKPERPFVIGHSIHFPPRYSEEFRFKPSTRKIKPFFHDNSYRPTKRAIEPHYIEPPIFLRDYSNHPKEQLFSTFIAPLFQSKIRVNIPKEKQIQEYNVESQMFRKKRIISLEHQRNKLRDCNPGDKNYKCSENSPDFFKEGGLIVGSTNKLRYNKTTKKGDDNFYQTLDLGIKVLNDNKLWRTKCAKEILNNDKKYVVHLNEWEENNFGLSKQEKNS